MLGSYLINKPVEGNKSIIVYTNIDNLQDAIDGNAGTTIVKE